MLEIGSNSTTLE